MRRRRSGPGARAARCGGSASVRPTIMCARPSRVAPATGVRPDDLAVAQHHDFVADLDSTSPSLCEMKMIARPSALSRRITPIRPSIFGRGEDRGRLVEHEQIGAAHQRLHDLDALALTERQILDDAAGIEPEPVACGSAAVMRSATPLRSSQNPAVAERQHDVVGDRHGVHQREVLVDHADAGARAPRAASRRQFGVLEDDRARHPAAPCRTGSSSACSCPSRSRRGDRRSTRP